MLTPKSTTTPEKASQESSSEMMTTSSKPRVLTRQDWDRRQEEAEAAMDKPEYEEMMTRVAQRAMAKG